MKPYERVTSRSPPAKNENEATEMNANMQQRLWRPDVGWWACEQPERPWNVNVEYHDEDCRACVVAMAAHVANGIVLILSDSKGREEGPLPEVYERRRAQFGLPPLAPHQNRSEK